jgi:hypothetical protein
MIKKDTVAGLEMFIHRPSGLDQSVELNRCKHCGHLAGFRDEGKRGHDSFSVSVECTNTSCGIKTPQHYKDRESAAKAWNRKAPTT